MTLTWAFDTLDGGGMEDGGLATVTSGDRSIAPASAWDQLEAESNLAYARFLQFRDLDPGRRSITVVARRYGVAVAALYKASSEFRWWDRVEAWDHHLRTLYDLNVAEQMRSVRSLTVAVAERLAKIAEVEATKLERAVRGKKKAVLDAGEITRIAKAAQALASGPGSVESHALDVSLGNDGDPAGDADGLCINYGELRLRLARTVVQKPKRGSSAGQVEPVDAEVLLEGGPPGVGGD
jgi:hypothetical protein